jgi:DNA-binding NtrC family response regulator
MERILILDDDPEMIETCRRILTSAGYECLCTTDPREGLALLETESPDLLMADLRMPGMDGLALLRRAREVDTQRPVMMITGFATIESAVAAVRAGAFDYLAKPFSLEQLRLAVDRALGQRRLALDHGNARARTQGIYGLPNIVGRSPALQRVLELVRKVSNSEANILVLGESGTGKELIARAIHESSARATHPFVTIDCASLPENLLESELFGHEKGAFTGAVATKPGLLEIARRGTVFLDEIAELPLGLQSKLLHVLQERRIRHVGGTHEIDIDVRVVSATSRDLRALVAAGEFREDLYYRINVVDLPLPPLRSRKEDVALLAHAFLAKFGERAAAPLKGFTAEALEMLVAYTWPGNVRELQNVVERGCALAEGDLITPGDLPAHLKGGGQFSTLGTDSVLPIDANLTLKQAKERWVGQLEAAYVTRVLRREGGNVSEAARSAGVDRKTLHRLKNKHHLR